MVENLNNKSSEIIFQADFKKNEERRYIVWNHLANRYDEYIIKKESSTQLALYVIEKNTKSPIFEFYGMWNDISDEDIKYIEESIQEVRKSLLSRFISKD